MRSHGQAGQSAEKAGCRQGRPHQYQLTRRDEEEEGLDFRLFRRFRPVREQSRTPVFAWTRNLRRGLHTKWVSSRITMKKFESETEHFEAVRDGAGLRGPTGFVTGRDEHFVFVGGAVEPGDTTSSTAEGPGVSVSVVVNATRCEIRTRSV